MMASESGHRPRTVALELGGDHFWVTTDQRGDLTSLIDEEGNTVVTVRYSAFGDRSVHGTELSPWGFAGKRLDASGFLYFGRRYYLPSWGRWLSPDPAGFVDGPNLCRFCLNNPLSFIDWLGEESESYRGDDLYGKGGAGGVKPEERVHSDGGSGLLRALLTAGGIAAAKYGRKVWDWMFHSGGEDLRLPERRWLVSLDGTAQMAGGLFEMGYGVGCCCTVVGAPLGAFLILHGFDPLVAGARRVTTGVHVDTLTCRLLQQSGFSPANAGLIDNGISIIGTLGAAFALRTFRAAAIGAGELKS